MASFEISLAIEQRLTCSVISFTICSFLLIYRIYQIRKYKTKLTKLTVLGMCSIIAANLFTAIDLVTTIMHYYGYSTYPTCKILYTSSRTAYALHRAFLYGFVVYRVEIVNGANRFSHSVTCVAKCIVVVCGIFLVLGMILFVEKPYRGMRCRFSVNEEVMAIGWSIDIVVCLASSWLFRRPLVASIRKIENIATQKTVEKEVVCISISLLLTVATVVWDNLVDGSLGVAIGTDCSVTTACLVAMAAPVDGSRTKHYLCCCTRGKKIEEWDPRSTIEIVGAEPQRLTDTMRLNMDVAALLEELGDTPAGEGEWFTSTDMAIAEGAFVSSEGLDDVAVAEGDLGRGPLNVVYFRKGERVTRL